MSELKFSISTNERLSNLSEEALESVLDNIKKISEVEDKDLAMKLTDKFIYQLYPQLKGIYEEEIECDVHVTDGNDFDYYDDLDLIKDESEVLNKIMHFERIISKCETELEQGNTYNSNFAILENSFDDIGINWSSELIEKFGQRVTLLKEKAKNLIFDANYKQNINIIESLKEEILKTPASVERAIEEIKIAESFLKKHNLLDSELTQKTSDSRYNIATIRAKRKFDESEVAFGAKNQKKYEKLIGEAEALLKVDWRKVFPGTEPPEKI